MEHVTMRVTKGDKVVADEVRAWLDVRTSPTGAKDWFGGFAIPRGKAELEPGDLCRIELGDGRWGNASVKSVGRATDQLNTDVKFRGFGEFATGPQS